MKRFKRVGSMFGIFVFFLTSCGPLNNSEPTFYENMTMLESYYNKYIFPNNPDAKLAETEYYQFLLKKPDNDNHNMFLVAWEVDKNSDQWNLKVLDITYYFEHKVLFLIYRLGIDSFVSPQESINEGILNTDQLLTSFQKMSEFVSYS